MRPASSNVGDVHSRQPAVVEVEQGRELDDVREQEREWQMQDELARVKRQRDELQQVRLIGGERDSQTGRQKDRDGEQKVISVCLPATPGKKQHLCSGCFCSLDVRATASRCLTVSTLTASASNGGNHATKSRSSKHNPEGNRQSWCRLCARQFKRTCT